MQDQKKTELFERTSIARAVLTLSVPTVLSSLVMILYNLADTYFVGMLRDPIQNSAVTLAAPVLLAFNAVNNLFGVGSSSMMSRALGAGDYDTVRRSSAFGFWCALACGAVFSLLATVLRGPLLALLGADETTAAATGAYMRWTVTCGAVPAILNVVLAYLVRAEGATLHASIGTMSGCALNIVLDPVFILPWGLDMGAAGAGLATFLANCAACLYFFVLLLVRRGKTCVCISPAQARPRREVAMGVFAVGVPASIQNLLNVTGMTVLNNFTAVYSPDAIAAMGISYKVCMIPMYVGMGISQGLMPLVSYNYGAGNPRRLKEGVLFAARLSLSLMVAVTAVFFFGSGSIISAFMKNEAVVAYGTRFMRCMCLAQPLLCMDFLAVGVFQACGLGRYALVFAILRKLVLEIPALYLWNRVWPLYGLACAQPTAEVVLAIAAVAILIRLFRRMEAEGTPLGGRKAAGTVIGGHRPPERSLPPEAAMTRDAPKGQ